MIWTETKFDLIVHAYNFYGFHMVYVAGSRDPDWWHRAAGQVSEGQGWLLLAIIAFPM